MRILSLLTKLKESMNREGGGGGGGKGGEGGIKRREPESSTH